MVKIDGYLVDVFLEEEHNFTSEVTSFPVESGSEISDHINNLPIEIKVTGLVSNTPIGKVAETRSREPILDDTEILPSEEALRRLLEIRSIKKLVTIESGLKTYETMALQELNIPNNKDVGEALLFTAVFKQVQLTEIRHTSDLAPKKLAPKKQKKVNKGQKVWTPQNSAVLVDLNGKPIPGVKYDENRSKWVNSDGSVVFEEDNYRPDEKATPFYYDEENQEWTNPDGSSVTKAQFDKYNISDSDRKYGPNPWWKQAFTAGSNAAK